MESGRRVDGLVLDFGVTCVESVFESKSLNFFLYGVRVRN